MDKLDSRCLVICARDPRSLSSGGANALRTWITAASATFAEVDLLITIPDHSVTKHWQSPLNCTDLVSDADRSAVLRIIHVAVNAYLPSRSFNYALGKAEAARVRKNLANRHYDLAIFDTMRTVGLNSVVKADNKILYLEDLLSDRYVRESFENTGSIFGAYAGKVGLGAIANSPAIGRILARREAQKLVFEELVATQDFDLVCLCGSVEVAGWRRRFGVGNVRWSPIVPTMCRPERDLPAREADGSARLVFLGTLTYNPNVRSLDRLIEQILPRLREVDIACDVDVIGKVPARVVADRQRPGVNFHGYIKNLPDYINEDALLLLPSSEAGGLKVKVLEALLAGASVATSPAIVEALAFKVNPATLFACANDDEYTDCTAAFLQRSKSKRHELAERGQQAAESIYGKDAVMCSLNAILMEAIS